jgi:hypothetical protein
MQPPLVPIALRGTADSQLSDDLHEVVYFSVHGRLTDFQMVLHANAGKEGQDHLGQHCRFRHWFLGFDVFRDQIFEKGTALGNNFLSGGWKHRELVHGIDRKTALLTIQAAGREFQKALDVFPSERIGGQQFLLLQFFQVVPQTFQIQISLICELDIEAGLVYARSLFQFLKAGIREAEFPEDRQRFLKHAFPAEVLGTSHRDIIAYRTDGFNSGAFDVEMPDRVAR